MEKFFTVNGKKYVITREFKFGKKKETYERIEVYDINGKKIFSNFQPHAQISKMIENAIKSDNKKKE